MSLDIERHHRRRRRCEGRPRASVPVADHATDYEISITSPTGRSTPSARRSIDTRNRPDHAHLHGLLPAGVSRAGVAVCEHRLVAAAGRHRGRGCRLIYPRRRARVEIMENLSAVGDHDLHLQREADVRPVRAGLGRAAAPALPRDSLELDDSNMGSVISALRQITLIESLSTLGYASQAAGQGTPGDTTKPYTGQEYAFQTMNDAATRERGVLRAGLHPSGVYRFPAADDAELAREQLPARTAVSSTAIYLRELPLVRANRLCPPRQSSAASRECRTTSSSPRTPLRCARRPASSRSWSRGRSGRRGRAAGRDPRRAGRQRRPPAEPVALSCSLEPDRGA